MNWLFVIVRYAPKEPTTLPRLRVSDRQEFRNLPQLRCKEPAASFMDRYSPRCDLPFRKLLPLDCRGNSAAEKSTGGGKVNEGFVIVGCIFLSVAFLTYVSEWFIEIKSSRWKTPLEALKTVFVVVGGTLLFSPLIGRLVFWVLDYLTEVP
jgi:hypothetical protein